MSDSRERRLARERLAAEVGRMEKHAPTTIALAYPSPYHVGMSSLGYQRIYRLVQELPGFACERAFLPDQAERSSDPAAAKPLTYESGRPLSAFPVVAFSVAYELELAGLVRMLAASGIGALRSARAVDAPVVVAGGPLTFSNPAPLGPFVDACVMGEAEEVFPRVLEVVAGEPRRAQLLDRLAELESVWVPAVHGEVLPGVARCSNDLLPARSAIRTPHTELRDMFLIETERGCSRGCTYCVMRRSTNGGMRVVPKDVILDAVPTDARRVGLVGAAVSDHPKIVDIVGALADSGREVGLSSLRPDRLRDEFVAALARAGHKTLTTALDGASERLRGLIERRGREPHFAAAAERARAHGMLRLKLYLMVGLPTETDADMDECARFVTELSRVVPIALGIAPFCPKKNTPMVGADFAGVRTVEGRLKRLRKALAGRADVRATSARWAWVESVLARGGGVEGRAALDAVVAGGSFADYRRAFEALGHRPDPPRARTARLAVVPS